MKPAKVLIIDDDQNIVFTIREICHFAELETIVAYNGKDGFELLKSEKPDLIIIDYHMPGWNGLTTVKKIRGINNHVAILVLTVDERQEIADDFISAGATDFSIKPIKAPDLIARIKVNLIISAMQKSAMESQANMFVEKGISNATLSLIKSYLSSHNEDVTIEEVAKGVTLAYQTVHRYMHFMLEEGSLEVIPVYGTVGRPKNKYRFKESAD